MARTAAKRRGQPAVSVETSPAATFFEQAGANAMVGLDGTITMANDTWLAIAAPVLNASTATPRRFDPEFWAPLAVQITSGGTAQHRSLLDYGGSAHGLWFHVLSGPSGAVSAVACVAMDIADLVAARKAAATARTRYDDISRLVSDWLWECDADLRLTFTTPRISHYLGLHPAQLSGHHLLQLGHFTHDPDAVAAGQPDPAGSDALPPEFAAQTPFRDELFSLTPESGPNRLFRMSGVPRFDDTTGDFLGFRGTARDITDLHSRENALVRAKEEAELANRTKTEFLANMSHELRTPLNAIIGFSEIIGGELFGAIKNPRYLQYVGDIHESAAHLLTVINDILDVSKAEAGALELSEGLVDLHQAIAASIRLTSERAVQGSVKIDTKISTVPVIAADERKIKQLLHNLLSNAIKFTPPGGSVTISAATTSNGDIEIAVSDTGIGMSQEQIAIALTPFGQVDSALNRAYEGTGLGVPLSKALVELHGGTLRITSVPSQGTTVTVTLPAKRAKQDIALI